MKQILFACSLCLLLADLTKADEAAGPVRGARADLPPLFENLDGPPVVKRSQCPAHRDRPRIRMKN